MKRMWSKNELKLIVKNTQKGIATLVDEEGHERFFKIDGTPLEQEGVTNKFCKASLSGTHLMLVFAFEVAEGTIIENNTALASFPLPEWILNKIYPIYGNLIERKQANASYAYTPVTFDTYLDKGANGVTIYKNNAYDGSYDLSVRISFDLLID